ncbi:MAG: RNA 3'-terminal phosphate cyclase [Phycisphaeraceae bacterium]|nr:RNA 3'-terminal phosphate cyclase [Phycisphaeraceae bacterium]
MVQLDGSVGEGGGQILRTALSLSMVTGTSFSITNIRANRPKPGLLRQHLTAVLAARDVCNGEVQGATVGSTEVTFTPGTVSPGEYHFSIGTAGSTTLVFQTLLPALMTADSPSTITLEGGTHNMFAPTVHFLQRSFVPMLARMGPKVDVALERYGFYPAGGGLVRMRIKPVSMLTPIECVVRDEITHRRAIATLASLPAEIGKRELHIVKNVLALGDHEMGVNQLKDTDGMGNVLGIELGDANHVEVFTGFGQRGVSAEHVARSAANEARDYLKYGAPIGTYLADQLMLPMALAGEGRFCTGPLSRHAETNAAVIESFLGTRIHQSHTDRITQIEIV